MYLRNIDLSFGIRKQRTWDLLFHSTSKHIWFISGIVSFRSKAVDLCLRVWRWVTTRFFPDPPLRWTSPVLGLRQLGGPKALGGTIVMCRWSVNVMFIFNVFWHGLRCVCFIVNIFDQSSKLSVLWSSRGPVFVNMTISCPHGLNVVPWPASIWPFALNTECGCFFLDEALPFCPSPP